MGQATRPAAAVGVRQPETWVQDLLLLATGLCRWPLGYLRWVGPQGEPRTAAVGLTAAEEAHAAALAARHGSPGKPLAQRDAGGPLRAWAAVPLAGGGLLAVADRRPRRLRADRLAALARLGQLRPGPGRPRAVSDAFHDLKNLLNVMTLNAALLARKVGAQGEALGRHVDLLHRAAADLGDLTTLLNEHAKLADAPPLEAQPLTLVGLVAGAEELARVEAEVIGVELAAHVEGELPLLGDRHRLTQALGYLIGAELHDAGLGARLHLWGRAEGARAVLGCRLEGAIAPPADGAARTRHALALEVARGVVLAHGGTWEALPRAGRLPEVRLDLPGAT